MHEISEKIVKKALLTESGKRVFENGSQVLHRLLPYFHILYNGKKFTFFLTPFHSQESEQKKNVTPPAQQGAYRG
jgi:hypothetical protein